MKAGILIFAWLTVFAVAVVSRGQKTSTERRQTSRDDPGLTRHDRALPETVPATLNPTHFRDDPGAFVAYALAGKIRAVLYQMLCYCYCNRRQGHKSLLDCYTSHHGRYCDVCRKEAIFAFLETKNGKSPAQIRRSLAKGEAWKMDLAKITDAWFPLLQEQATADPPPAAAKEFDSKESNVVPSKGEQKCPIQNQR
jgi:hypothetical protein